MMTGSTGQSQDVLEIEVSELVCGLFLEQGKKESDTA